MLKKSTIIGAAIGGVIGFAIQATLAVIAGPMGVFELAFTFLMVCIVAATGAAVGSVVGLIVGIAVKAFSRKKE